MPNKPRLLILGSGWAGYELLRCINRNLYNVHIVSPRNYFVFTPLLASTCTGTLEFRTITEPIRRIHPDINYYQAYCNSVDIEKQTISCRDASKVESHQEFSLPWDKLVIACGAVSNTFGIPGVKEHAFFLKDIEDARSIRHRVLDCFENAKQPFMGEDKKRALLHFAVVGGGPTGIEFSAELHDLIRDDLSKFYPDLVPLAKITVYDVSKRILGSFDEKLAAYATEKFARDGIEIATESRIVSVGEDHLELTGRGRVDVGMTVWATGLAAAPLTGLLGKTSGLMMDQRGFRLLTDSALRVKLASSGKALDNAYAIGDCATIQDYETPCTAQVAYQKARHLAIAILNKPVAEPRPFTWKNRGMLSYVGGWKAVADLGPGSFSGSGRVAWLLWRSAYFVMTVSVRNKILIPMYWFLTWLFGRDITKI